MKCVFRLKGIVKKVNFVSVQHTDEIRRRILDILHTSD